MKLKAKSSTVHTISKVSKPATTKQFVGKIYSKRAPIRTSPGGKSKETSFSPLAKGRELDVLDSILSKAGNTWYYIRYKNKYGYIHASHVKTFRDYFVKRLEAYHTYIKDHSSKFIYDYDSDIKTFTIAKKEIGKGHKVHITCVAPVRWGLHALGVATEDFDSLIYGEDGHFKHFNGNANKYLKKITKDGPIGKTWKKAIDDGSLKKGDIVVFKGYTHTSVYSGKDYIFFDSGRTSFSKGLSHYGIKHDYNKQNRYKDDKISEVLRWR